MKENRLEMMNQEGADVDNQKQAAELLKEKKRQSRRKFIKQGFMAAGGVAVTLGAAEASKYLPVNETRQVDNEPGERLEHLMLGEAYTERLQAAIFSGYNEAYSEALAIAERKAYNKMTAGGITATVATTGILLADGKKEEVTNTEESLKDKASAFIEGVIPPIAASLVGAVPGIVDLNKTFDQKDFMGDGKLSSKLKILQAETENELKNLNVWIKTNYDIPVQSRQQASQKYTRTVAAARKSLQQIGLINVQPTELDSVKKAAKEFAEKHFNAINHHTKEK